MATINMQQFQLECRQNIAQAEEFKCAVAQTFRFFFQYKMKLVIAHLNTLK